MRRVLEESQWEGMRSKRSHGLGSDNHTCGSCQGARRHLRERGDMTGSHQHLRSYAARTLHRGVGYADATLPHTRTVLNHRRETRAFLFYPVGVGGRP